MTAPTARQTAPAWQEPVWRDPARPVDERIAALLGEMTLEEKLAQLASIWMGAAGEDGGVAPIQDEMITDLPPLDDLIQHGMGQLTRVFGTRPVAVGAGIRALDGLQARIMAASRFGLPAIAHEECLTGFAAWKATIFPTPLAWGASFDPGLVQDMATAIGASMRAVGVHQGLAPVLDVTRDARWGRTEETIGEDPYLVGTIGTAYVVGLQSTGVHATLKHFAGYSASRAGRNMAPVSMGRREFRDVILPPFEMALRFGAPRAVMPTYIDTDGIPATGDHELLDGILRDELGFDGVVVSDYFAVSFLELMHAVAGTQADAAALALAAGVDVELPSVRCYGAPLAAAVRDERLPPAAVDRAVSRVLRQKCELGMLDPGWSPIPATPGDGQVGDGQAAIDLDPAPHRKLARRLAEESVILLANPAGVLPLSRAANTDTVNIAVTGPLADDRLAFFGCYSMPRHLSGKHPEAADGLDVTTVLGALRDELPQAKISYSPGCDVRSADRSGFAAAVEQARIADVVVAVIGDEAGMFGRGTSGEGCDVTSLRLPGVQQDLLAELIGTGTPVVAALVTGRPYAIGEVAGDLAAVVQAFFPGEEGGCAIAGVLTGRVVPSGKLPVEVPSSPAGQPSPYLRSPLAAQHSGSAADPTPLYAFGHGLSYTSFEYSDLGLPSEITTDGMAEIACTVRNTGDRAGSEVVQLYLSDPVAQVVRPVRWLAGFARVPLSPGESRRVTFRLHADRTAFHGLAGRRIVEPGEILLGVGGASDHLPLRGSFTLTGPERAVGPDRVLDTPVLISDPTA
ncbi:MAG: glycoside hydrolase family 3 C-terminal domain-containing protein [Streptosporangiaceae bacterium]|nr:glycoside hydrolase family 3 C-terminal domain-containing protein [Streptosporangiaceae bacterium]